MGTVWLTNKATGTEEPVPDTDVDVALASGRYAAPDAIAVHRQGVDTYTTPETALRDQAFEPAIDPAIVAAQQGHQIRERANTGVGPALRAFAGGATSGLTFGLVDPYQDEQEFNPLASGVGQAAGAIAPAFVGDVGGLLGIGSKGARLADDALSLERAGSSLSSKALYAGEAVTDSDRALASAGKAVDRTTAAVTAARDADAAGLTRLDAAGLRAAHESELSRLASEQSAQRTVARSAVVDDVLAYRQVVKDADPWLAISEGEDAARLSKSNKALRSALDDVKGLRENPASLARPLRTEEQALEGAIKNRAEIAAKLDAVNAKIAEELEARLPKPAPKPAPKPVQAGSPSASPIEQMSLEQIEGLQKELDAKLATLDPNSREYVEASKQWDAAVERRAQIKSGAPAVQATAHTGPPSLTEDEFEGFANEWRKNLTPESERALQAYSGNGVYATINGPLRKGEGIAGIPAQMRPVVEEMDRAIASARVPRETTVYRGVSGVRSTRQWGGASVGDTVTDAGFGSTTAQPHVGRSYARGMGVRQGVELRITVPEGSVAAPLPSKTFGSERELLLPRGTKYTVTKIEEAGGVRIVDVVADTGVSPVKPTTIELTGKAARRYASFADVKLGKGKAVTLTADEAKGFVQAIRDGRVTGQSQEALGKLAGLLEQNRALQEKIKGATTAALPKSELASDRLTAIRGAQDALASPKAPTTLLQKLAGGTAFGAVAGLAHALPGGSVLAPFLGAKAADLASAAVSGGFKKAMQSSAERAGSAAASFLDVASKVARTPQVPVLATATLASLSYGKSKGEQWPSDLPGLFKARTDEIKNQVHIAADGSFQMRPEARQELASKLRAVRAVDPIVADRLETAGARRIEWLASQIPRRPDAFATSYGPDRWQPSDLDMRSWARKAAAVEDPSAVFERVVHGTVTPEDAEAMRAVWPEKMQDFIRQVASGLTGLQKALPYSRRMALSLFTGQPVDPALDPKIFAVLQSQFPDEPGSQGGTQAPKATPSFGSMPKSPNAPTPSQYRAQGAVHA